MTLWSDLEEPLRCCLAGMGLSRHDIDDITQETAARALEKGIAATNPEALRPWAFVVAKRLAYDLHRGRRRLVEMDEVHGPDVVQAEQLTRVEDRHLLRTVASAVARLPAGERDSFANPRLTRTTTERQRANVARYRARRRLKLLVGPLTVTVAWVRRQGPTLALSGAAAAAVLPLAVVSVERQQARPERPTHLVISHDMQSAALDARPINRRASSSPGAPRMSSLHSPDARRSGAEKNSTATVILVGHPQDTGVSVGTRQPKHDDPLICVRGLPEPVCVYYKPHEDDSSTPPPTGQPIAH